MSTNIQNPYGGGLAGLLGTGTDGTVTLDGVTTFNNFSTFNAGTQTYTLTRDVFFNSLVINPTATLAPAGFRIFCMGLLHMLNGSTINGTGLNASGSTGGAAQGSGSFLGGRAGGGGGTGVNGAGAAGTSAPLGTGGGAGGAGTSGTAGAGGTISGRPVKR